MGWIDNHSTCNTTTPQSVKINIKKNTPLQESQQVQVPEVEDFEFCFCLYLSVKEKGKKRQQCEFVLFEKTSRD